jgi:cytochrome c oxidase subunit 3
MSFLDALTDKPWIDNVSVPDTPQIPAQKIRKTGLRILLVVISMLFFLFLVAFLMRSQYTDWQPLAEEPNHPLYNQSILWLNTIFLVCASVFIQIARFYGTRSMRKVALAGTLIAGLFSIAFITGQLLFWQHLVSQGFVVSINPAMSFFYLFTGLHAAHVAIGILVWVIALAATVKSSAKYPEMINLCGTYWHFLLGLWCLLFATLVSKPETYDAIAAFCGLR